MKISVKQLREMINEELLKEALPAPTQDFHQSQLGQGFQILVKAFPGVLTNQILVQKLGGQNMDNRSVQAAGQQAQEYVAGISKQFETDLQSLIEKHFVSGVKNFQPSGPAPAPAPRAPAGQGPNQGMTMPPPPMDQ